MGLDLLTLGCGLLSFGLFLGLQMVLLRRVRAERLLRSLTASLAASLLCPVILTALFSVWFDVRAPLWALGLAAIMAAVVQLLLSAVYVLCFFGPWETSIRMHLVRQIATGGSLGMTREEILQRYNAERITRIRLERLSGSGDVCQQGGLYRIGHSRSLFLLLNAVGGILKKWIGR